MSKEIAVFFKRAALSVGTFPMRSAYAERLRADMEAMIEAQLQPIEAGGTQ